MKISELSPIQKRKALQYQKNANEFLDKKTDDLSQAFNWKNTQEGFNYWQKLKNETSVISQIKAAEKRNEKIAAICIVLIVIFAISGYLIFML
jgi:ABC-type transport system involved in cytochrome bd biosynthesis fused ATPase/permease subunit